MKYPGTPIPLPLRLWFGVEVFFGVSAVLTIALSPGDTRTNFAWPVQPVVMAAVLGAFYVSSALLFLLPLFARRWEMIRVMILTTGLFSAAELLATILHWSSFTVGSVPFIAWFVSYLLPPPIFFGFYFWLERRARGVANSIPSEPLPPGVRNALRWGGGSLTLLALFIFIVPQVLIANAPWAMTPLTARAFDAWLIAAGTLMLSMARENDKSRVLFGVPMLILMFPAVTLQIARFPDQVNFGNPSLYLIYGFMLFAFVLGLYLVRGNWSQVFQ